MDRHTFKPGDVVMYREGTAWTIEAQLADFNSRLVGDRLPLKAWHYIQTQYISSQLQDKWHERSGGSLLIDCLTPHPDPDAFWAGYTKAVLLDEIVRKD